MILADGCLLIGQVSISFILWTTTKKNSEKNNNGSPRKTKVPVRYNAKWWKGMEYFLKRVGHSITLYLSWTADICVKSYKVNVNCIFNVSTNTCSNLFQIKT